MGNVITNPGAEDEDIKTFLSKTKGEFEGKWELESKNAELVKYFQVSEYNLLKWVESDFNFADCQVSRLTFVFHFVTDRMIFNIENSETPVSYRSNLFRTVGTGSFGRVMVCNEKDSENYLAVKCLSKDCIMEKEQVWAFLETRWKVFTNPNSKWMWFPDLNHDIIHIIHIISWGVWVIAFSLWSKHKFWEFYDSFARWEPQET